MENRAEDVLDRDEPLDDDGGVAAAVDPVVAFEIDAAPADPDDDWIAGLHGDGLVRDDAIRRLHELMIRASRYKLARMSEARRLGRARAEEIVQSSADEAVMAILRRLDSFEGRSRFTTWAYKFAILHTATAVRRELWTHAEVDLDAIPHLASPIGDPLAHAEGRALAQALRRGIDECLTPHQRRILLAIVVEGIPIDVVADRLSTTRNTVYKTLHDARKRLREQLQAQGFLPPAAAEEVNR